MNDCAALKSIYLFGALLIQCADKRLLGLQSYKYTNLLNKLLHAYNS